MRPTLDDAREALRRWFGYPDFRGGQPDAIRAVLSGRDVLVLMPTGGGKSLCYQVPALVLPGTTLVVSPLISLMQDQVDALRARGIGATFVNSTLSAAEVDARLEDVEQGRSRILYVAPERFGSPRFLERLRRLRVSFLAVDEAHCISEWGHSFRPHYLRLGAVRDLLGCQVLALTATATPEVRRDITEQLRLRDPVVVVRGFDRPNLSWHVLRARNEDHRDRLLLALLRNRPAEGEAIVYAATRKAVDAVTDMLNRAGIPAAGYHAGIPGPERRRLQENFMDGDGRIVVATNAFGMGIDKPDVRLVAHYNLPGSLEGYYQEAGRAGRDGQPSRCFLLYGPSDRRTHRFLIDQAHPPRNVIIDVYDSILQSVDGKGATTLEVVGRTARLVLGAGQLDAAIRILEDAGIVERRYAAAHAPEVRLIASLARIRRELDDPASRKARGLIDALFRLGDPYRGVELRDDFLAGLAGSTDDARRLLASLQQRGFLEWTPWPGRDGLQLLVRVRPGRIPVDWARHRASRKREERKFRSMEGFARTRRCRRGYVLRYFGDPDAMRRCTSCDNCLGSSDRILPPDDLAHAS